MVLKDYGTIWVCTDCYFAHHYGVTWMSREANGDLFGPWTADERAELIGEHNWVWYAGDGDTPCELEPLGKIGDDFHIFDATCSDHANGWHTEPDPDDEDDWIDVPDPCPHCGGDDDENGIQEFSHSSCQGCGSHLGGSRYRLSLSKETA